MATVGQIVYNLQDLHSSGVLISTADGTLNSTVSSDSSTYESSKIDIFSDVVSRFTSTGFTKVGIQAPPGTKVNLNNGKIIMIGRTGVYELDEDITITKMYFVRPKKYVLNESATSVALSTGVDGLSSAESTRETALEDLDTRYADKDKDTAYWEEYTSIQTIYQEAYESALALYTLGVYGIYELPNTEDADADENYEDLYNVIVDFIY